MAFTHIGNIGTALSTSNNQASLVMTTSAALEAGNLGVLIIAVDNPTGTEGPSTAVSSVTNSGTAATWTRAVGFTNTNGGAAQDGADISIWYAQPRTTIASGATITATFANATTSDASAMSCREFTVATGSKIGVSATNTLANDAAAQGSLNATTPNAQHLRVRAIASESSSTTALTPTSTWTIFTQAISGAGTSATEIGIRGEFLISTDTSAASAPTGGAGAVDHASAYVAFIEVPVFEDFDEVTQQPWFLSAKADTQGY